MTWSIANAVGHTPDEDTERELARRLSDVLSDPKYGASENVSFQGSYVHGSLRTTEGWLKEEPS